MAGGASAAKRLLEPEYDRPMSDRPVSGKWFEELTEGLVIQHVIRRTITEADNVGLTAF